MTKLFLSSLLLSLIVLAAPSYAQVPGLNYPTRSHPYAGWSGIVKGDNNTMGMAGATVALPVSIAAMEYNPAGFAMNLGGASAQINSFTNREPSLNHGANNYTDYEWGVGTSLPPWGFGLEYYAPITEHSDTAEDSVRSARIAVARMLGPNLAVGVAIGFDKGIRKMDGQDMSGTHVSGQIGALYKLEDHWVLGASYSPGLTVGPTSNSVQDNVASFNQDILVPHVMALGVGFMPNRFFRVGFSILGVTGTPGAALLYDQNVAIGSSFTVEPRLGSSYVVGEWSFLKIELATGTYWEQSRIQGIDSREHVTFGLDVNPWFFNTGVGTDIAKGYVNWVASLGIDMVRTFRFFKVIPPDPVPFYNAALPPALKIDPNGLADGFTQGEKKDFSPPSAGDVKNIVTDIPKKLDEKFGGTLPDSPPPVQKEEGKAKRVKKHKKSTHHVKPKPSPTPTTNTNE